MVDGVVECVIVVDAGHGDTYVVATHKLASKVEEFEKVEMGNYRFSVVRKIM